MSKTNNLLTRPTQDAARAQLERSAQLRAQTIARAQHLETDAEAMIAHLNTQLPDLARAVEHVTDPQARQDANAKYLQARANLHRCHQNFRLARRQRILAANL